MRRRDRGRGRDPRGAKGADLFRNRLSRTKGMTPALCFECALLRTNVATLSRFVGFQWASLVALDRRVCRTFDAVFSRRKGGNRGRQDGKFEFDRLRKLVVKLSAIRPSSRDREDRFARFCRRDIGDIKTQRERERGRGAHTILSYSPAMYRFPRTKTYDGWRVYRLTNSNGV